MPQTHQSSIRIWARKKVDVGAKRRFSQEGMQESAEQARRLQGKQHKTRPRPRMKSRCLPLSLLLHVAALSWSSDSVLAYVPPSSFHGRSLALEAPRSIAVRQQVSSSLTMRKQKASDKRTTRLQRGEGLPAIYDDAAVMQSLQKTLTSSPMADAVWEQKVLRNQFQGKQPEKSGGRGRSRKRSSLYHCLSNYHEQFLTLLTAEYKAEVRLLRFS
jgi:hypothetical protein